MSYYKCNGPVIIFRGNGKGPVCLVCVDTIWKTCGSCVKFGLLCSVCSFVCGY